MPRPSGHPATHAATRTVAVLRYPRRPSELAALALLMIVIAIAAVTLWERRTFIDACLRDDSGILLRSAESPYLIAQQPDIRNRGPVAPSSGLTLEPQLASLGEQRPPWRIEGMIAWRIGCHIATAAFLALAMLYFFRRWAMPPAAAFLLSSIPAAMYLLLPGPMAHHLALTSASAEVLVYAAALLLLDSVLDSRRQDLPVLAMVLEVAVLFLGAWAGPYFWMWAALIYGRRLVTGRWRTLTSHLIGGATFLVPCVMGAVAAIASARSLPLVAREVLAMFPGAPGFWAAGMTESYGVFGLAALGLSAVAACVGLFVGFRDARRTTFVASGAWSVATLLVIVLAAPVIAEAFIRIRSTPWDIDALYYAPAVALAPFALVPAFVWTLLPHPTRRLPLFLATVSGVLAIAVLAHEHPRFRGLLPHPVLSVTVARQDDVSNGGKIPFDVVEFRIRPVDTSWCRAYVVVTAATPPSDDWNLRIQGMVADDAISSLDEFQRDRGRGEWMIPLPASAFPKSPRTLMAWRNLRMRDLEYDLTLDFTRTDATGSNVRVFEIPWHRVHGFNPFDQRDTCTLQDGGFESTERTPWIVASSTSSLVERETTLTYRGSGALRLDPGAYYSIVQQDIHSLASLAGRTITFRAMARASEPGTARLMLNVAGGKYYSHYHPGDGGWHELLVRAPVPLQSDVTEFNVNIVHGGKPKQRAVFDEAQIDVR